MTMSIASQQKGSHESKTTHLRNRSPKPYSSPKPGKVWAPPWELQCPGPGMATEMLKGNQRQKEEAAMGWVPCKQ